MATLPDSPGRAFLLQSISRTSRIWGNYLTDRHGSGTARTHGYAVGFGNSVDRVKVTLGNPAKWNRRAS
jgi:hypothetical protein